MTLKEEILEILKIQSKPLSTKVIEAYLQISDHDRKIDTFDVRDAINDLVQQNILMFDANGDRVWFAFDVSPRTIVCAANRKDWVIVCGARHFDNVMREQIKRMNMDFKNWEQGFIDQYGNFLTREQAYHVASLNGQIVRRCGGDEGRLFSENLY